jgi:hypothetical protein
VATPGAPAQISAHSINGGGPPMIDPRPNLRAVDRDLVAILAAALVAD